MSEQPPSIGYALRGLLAWLLCSIVAIGCLVLLGFWLSSLGIDLTSGVNPRERPFAALAMLVAVMLVVAPAFYVGMIVAVLLLKPFISRTELKAHFVEQLGLGKLLGRLHARLFELVLRRRG